MMLLRIANWLNLTKMFVISICDCQKRLNKNYPSIDIIIFRSRLIERVKKFWMAPLSSLHWLLTCSTDCLLAINNNSLECMIQVELSYWSHNNTKTNKQNWNPPINPFHWWVLFFFIFSSVEEKVRKNLTKETNQIMQKKLGIIEIIQSLICDLTEAQVIKIKWWKGRTAGKRT